MPIATAAASDIPCPTATDEAALKPKSTISVVKAG